MDSIRPVISKLSMSSIKRAPMKEEDIKISDSFVKNNNGRENKIADFQKAAKTLFKGGMTPPKNAFMPKINPYDCHFPEISSNDVIFAPDRNRNLKAIDGKTGKTLWKNDLDPDRYSPLLSPDEKTVFVADNNNSLRAVDAATGKDKWKYKADYTFLPHKPSITSDGKTLFTGDHNCLAALDAKTGEEVWKLETRDEFKKGVMLDGELSPVLSPDEKSIIATTDKDVKIWNIDAKTGKTRWVKSPKWLWASQAVDLTTGPDGTVYVANGIGQIAAMDGRKGKIKWENYTIKDIDYDVTRGNISLIPSPDGKNLFGVMPRVMDVKGDYAKVINFDPRTGKPKWEYKYRTGTWPGRDRPRKAELSGDGRTLLIGDDSGGLHALDTETGSRKWISPGYKNHIVYNQKYNHDESKILVLYVKNNGEENLEEDQKLQSVMSIIDADTGLPIADFTEEGLINKKNQPRTETDSDNTAKEDPEVELREETVIIGGVELPVRKS